MYKHINAPLSGSLLIPPFLLAEIVDEVKFISAKHTIIILPGRVFSVYADREKIGQVVTNFLSNAVKYSPVGTVVRVSAQALEDHMITVCIKDEDTGFMEKDRDKLFDRYYRVDNVQTRKVPALVFIFLPRSSSNIKVKYG